MFVNIPDTNQGEWKYDGRMLVVFKMWQAHVSMLLHKTLYHNHPFLKVIIKFAADAR